jgi:hypothetical protein
VKSVFLTDRDLNLAEIEADADSVGVAERGVITNATVLSMRRRSKARGINLHICLCWDCFGLVLNLTNKVSLACV